MPISGPKLEEILAIKSRLGLPDERLGREAPQPPVPQRSAVDLNSLVDRVMARLESRE